MWFVGSTIVNGLYKAFEDGLDWVGAKRPGAFKSAKEGTLILLYIQGHSVDH